MQDINQTQVLGVEGKPTRNNSMIYRVSLADGNSYGTFDQGLATKAQSLVGQLVDARVEFEGTYKNLKDIAPAGMLPPLALPPGQPVQMPQQQFQPQPMPGPQFAPPPIPMAAPDTAKDESIARAVAFKASSEIVAALFHGAGPEALDEALSVVKTVAADLYPILLTGAPAGQPQPETPAQVAEQVNGQLPDAVQVGANVPQWA